MQNRRKARRKRRKRNHRVPHKVAQAGTRSTLWSTNSRNPIPKKWRKPTPNNKRFTKCTRLRLRTSRKRLTSNLTRLRMSRRRLTRSNLIRSLREAPAITTKKRRTTTKDNCGFGEDPCEARPSRVRGWGSRQSRRVKRNGRNLNSKSRTG
jgi:hypothetical protein